MPESTAPTADDKEHEFRTIVERFWTDIISLPHNDPGWATNQHAREQTRQHFVNATVADLLRITNKNEETENGEESLDA